MATHRDEIGWQGPINDRAATTYGELFTIVIHPAFRIGFLDALTGKPLDHDRIADRIVAETPPKAFERMKFALDGLFSAPRIEVAQYRYEEGRLAVIQEGLRCKAWGHPDFPPAQVREYIRQRSAASREATGLPDQSPTSVVAALRGDGLPLFAPPAAGELG